jgi:dinuclear metal center YbgI/SA1388 family protein
MVALRDLVDYTNGHLNSAEFEDYAPNGLQVEGRAEVTQIVSGVTASLALIEAAVRIGADCVLVHHGYFWKNEDSRITGMKQLRIKQLLAHDISLMAYHLPLDAHPQLGNNVQLASRLGFTAHGKFGHDGKATIALRGKLIHPMTAAELSAHILRQLGRQPLHIAGRTSMINSIAWCTGAAQEYFDQAVELGVDAYLTGEVSEQTTHIARETGVHFFAAGHHATERYGVQALGAHLAEKFGVKHQFIDIDNPV